MRLFYALWENPHKFPHKFMKNGSKLLPCVHPQLSGHTLMTCQSWRGLVSLGRCGAAGSSEDQ